MNKSEILQILLRGIIGAFISGVGVLAQYNHGVARGIMIVIFAAALFYGLTVFGTPLGTFFINLGNLFYAVVTAGILGVIISTKFDFKYAIIVGAVSCMFFKRIEVNKPKV